MKQITNKTLLKQGDKTYQPIEIRGIIYWGNFNEELKDGEMCFLKENHYINGGIVKYNAKKAIGYGLGFDFFMKIVAQSKPNLEGIPVISLDSYVERLCNTRDLSYQDISIKEINAYKNGFVNSYISNPNQYTQKDIELAVEFARLQHDTGLGTMAQGYTDMVYTYSKEQIFEQINSISVIEVDAQFNVINYE
jgi:protein tyrosine phosphatase